MKRKSVVVAGVIGFCFNVAAVQASSLYDELMYLQQNHPLLSSVNAQHEAAQQSYRGAKGGRMPVVALSAQGGFEHQNRPAGVRTDEDPEAATLSVTQLLWDGGAIKGGINAAESRINVAGLTATLTEQDLLQVGIRTYFGLVFATQRLDQAIESVSRIGEQQETEAKKMEEGKGSKADFLQAESQLLAAQAGVATEEGAVQIAKNAYIQVFGKPAPDASAMQLEAFPSKALPTNLAEAEGLALGNAPGLAAARAAQVAARHDFDAAKGTYFPRIDAVVEGAYRSDAQAVVGEVSEARAFVRVTYNFDLGLSRRGVVGAARAVQQATVYDAANQERVVLEAIRSAWQRHMTARKNYEISVRQLESATQFLELAKKERELGKRTLQDILNGELVRLAAKTRLAGAQAEVSTSSFDIMRTTGQLNLSVL